jgi:hypothetical protein
MDKTESTNWLLLKSNKYPVRQFFTQNWVILNKNEILLKIEK